MSRWTDKSEQEIAELSRRNKIAWSRYESARKDLVMEPKPKNAPKSRQKSRSASGKAIPTEHQEQVTLMRLWAIYAKSHGLDERLLFAIPNGSNKSMTAAARFKAEGLRSGVPDSFLAIPRFKEADDKSCWKSNNGLWVELKRISWKEPSSGAKAIHWRNQCAFHQLLQNQGYRVRVCAGADSAMAAIRDYLS